MLLGKDGSPCCIQLFQLLSVLVPVIQIFLYISCAVVSSESAQMAVLNDYVAFQIADEWTKKPWTSISIQNGECADYEEPFFYHVWQGTDRGCKVYYDGRNRLMTLQRYNEISSRKNNNDDKYTYNEKCENVHSLRGVKMSTVWNKKICGQRGGLTYVNTTRPVDGVCPTGFSKCSTLNTDDENTLCYPSDRLNECPITFIEIVADADLGSYPTQDYTHLSFKDSYSIVYSKTYDAMPILETKLEYEACILPGDVSGEVGKQYYLLGKIQMLERSQSIGCSSFQERTVDPRYTKLEHLNPTEYTLQSENGVLRDLGDLYKYREYVPNDNVKQNYEYYFQVRNTIPWKLECENYATRPYIVDLFQDAEDDYSYAHGIMILSIIFTVFNAGALIVFNCCQQKEDPTVGNIIFFIFGAIFLMVNTLMIYHGLLENDARKDQFKEYSVVNGCVDEVTFIDYELRESQLNEANDYMKAVENINRAIMGVFCLLFALPFFDAVTKFLQCCCPFLFVSDQEKKYKDPNVIDQQNNNDNNQDFPNPGFNNNIIQGWNNNRNQNLNNNNMNQGWNNNQNQGFNNDMNQGWNNNQNQGWNNNQNQGFNNDMNQGWNNNNNQGFNNVEMMDQAKQ